MILEERYSECRQEIRDPYPTIGEKATGKWGRILCSICIVCTLYGAGCVLIILIAELLQSILQEFEFDVSLCLWMCMVAIILTPLTWLGTPKDFW